MRLLHKVKMSKLWMFVFCVGFVGPSLGQPPAGDGIWTTKAPMQRARIVLSSSVVDGKIYAIGGSPAFPGVAWVEEYDPGTDTWTSKADMPTARANPSASVVNGRIYAIGGAPSGHPSYRGLSAVEEYDPATDTWRPKADMPTARTLFSTSVVNGRVYAIGGFTSGLGGRFSTVEEYDPATDTWTRKAGMPTPRSMLTTSVVNGKIYAIGGSIGNGPNAIATVEEYDPYPLIVDFNGDGVVDGADILAMVDCWGTDDSLCDIGPMPWGDGVVDVEDLTVLAEYIGEEVDDPTLMAHWAFDETAGDIAYDSGGTNDGMLLGEPVWESQGGMVNGALRFDGSDDSMATSQDVLNPAAGPFSIVAWIKGGAPGQTIVSQIDGVNWLSLDGLTGTLTTELTQPVGRFPVPPLVSDWIITDGLWHRVAFVWDGSNRSLYVDGVLVSTDEQDGLAGSDGGLHIGCGADQSPGSFFSGLIDDVRIYDRVVTP